MVSVAHTYRLPLTALLLGAGIVAAFLLFWILNSPLSTWTGVDLGFLFLPIAVWACLLLLSRFFVPEGLAWGPTLAGKGWLFSVLPFAQKLLSDLAWFALVLGLLTAVPTMTSAISNRPGGPELASFDPYVQVFGSMALWGSVVLVPVAVARAIAEMRPGFGVLLTPPWSRLAFIGLGYVFLANGGVLNVSFGFQGFTYWLALAVALGLAYGALVIRNRLNEPPQPRLLFFLRAQLVLIEATWIAVTLAAVAVLPSRVESVLVSHFALDPDTAASYAKSLGALTSPQAFAVMLPFALVRAVWVFRPTVGRILGFPIGRLALLGIVHVIFSEGGVLWVAFGVSVSQLMAALMLAIALTYMASIMGNIGKIRLPGRYGTAAKKALSIASSATAALAAGLAVWTVVDHLPVANAALLDHEATRNLGRRALPYFSMLVESRYIVTAFGMALTFALSQPWPWRDKAVTRRRLLFNASCYGAGGYFAWMLGIILSPLGHGFVLGGVAVAMGMFALALAQALQCATFPYSTALTPIVRRFTASRVRVFVLGATFAFYGLLLRPALYEVLWFAALYEYIALLALLALVLIFVTDLLRRTAAAPTAQIAGWSNWSHHRQTLESKEDPRSALTSAMRQDFLDRLEWKPLWTYLMGLLCRNGASLEWMYAVCQPLRASAVSSSKLRFIRWRNRGRMGRITALEDALRRTDSALAATQAPVRPITEDELLRAAAPFVETGAEVERFVVALIAAHCQQGDDLQRAIDQWFPLLNSPDPLVGRIALPWSRSRAGAQRQEERVSLVNGAVEILFDSATPATDGAGEAWKHPEHIQMN